MDGYGGYPSGYPPGAGPGYNEPSMQRPPSQSNNSQSPHSGMLYLWFFFLTYFKWKILPNLTKKKKNTSYFLVYFVFIFCFIFIIINFKFISLVTIHITNFKTKRFFIK